MLNKDNQSVDCEIRSLTKSTKYRVRVVSKNQNGYGVYSQYVTLETTDFDIKQWIKSQMVFDRSINAPKIKIVNDLKIVAVETAAYQNAIRLKYPMPTQ